MRPRDTAEAAARLGVSERALKRALRLRGRLKVGPLVRVIPPVAGAQEPGCPMKVNGR